MRLSIGAAGEVDLVSTEEFQEGIGGLRRMLSPTSRDRSIRRTIPRSITTSSNGSGVMNFGGPPSGAIWYPLWITVVGPDDHTSYAGHQVAVYVGGEAMVQAPLANLLIPASTATGVPFERKLSSRDGICAHFGDNVFVLFYGDAEAAPFVGVLRVREVHPSNIEELNFLE
jgi:hypothetical protein